MFDNSEAVRFCESTRGPRTSPAKRVVWGEDERRNERALTLRGEARDMESVRTKQGLGKALPNKIPWRANKRKAKFGTMVESCSEQFRIAFPAPLHTGLAALCTPAR